MLFPNNLAEDLRSLAREEIDARLGIVRADRHRASNTEITLTADEETRLAQLEEDYLYGVSHDNCSSLTSPKFFAGLVSRGCVLGFGILLGDTDE